LCLLPQYGKVDALKQIRAASVTSVKETAQLYEKNAFCTYILGQKLSIQEESEERQWQTATSEPDQQGLHKQQTHCYTIY
jgi:hypothetical protein